MGGLRKGKRAGEQERGGGDTRRGWKVEAGWGLKGLGGGGGTIASKANQPTT